MKLLAKINNLISVSHKEAIQKVFSTIKDKLGFNTKRETQFEATRLTKQISNKEIVFDPVYADKDSKIDSLSHNQNLEGAYIDLYALYKETNSLNIIQSSQKASLVDGFSKAKAGILKLINDARVFAARSKSPEFDDIKVVNFNIARNASDVKPAAMIDNESRLLKLPPIINRRVHLAKRGVRVTSITAETMTDGDMGQIGRQFTPALAVDAKTETFWADTVYSDALFQVDHVRSSPNSVNKMVDTINGPVTKVSLKFSNAEAINQVRILPFASYPIKVLEIRYKTTGSSLVYNTIAGFEMEESLDWVEFNFDVIYASEIQIVLAQENYKTISIKIPKSILFSTDFFLRLMDARKDDLSSTTPLLEDVQLGGINSIYSEAVEDLSALLSEKNLDKSPTMEIDLAGKTILALGESMVSFGPALSSLLEEVSTYTELSPKNIQDDVETINKYEFVIGAREIETNYNIYSPIGYYESEKLEPRTTVSYAELEVDERHLEFTSPYGDYRKTSTEWAIEFAEDRSVPIFPVNHISDDGYLHVREERLVFDQTSFSAYSRFVSLFNFAIVRENDILLANGTDYTVEWDGDGDGRVKITINENRFRNSNLYVVEYYAHPDSSSIDVLAKFNDKKIAVPDMFEETGPDNNISLKYAPYINYGVINSDNFAYNSSSNSYEYDAPTGAYATGLARVYPDWIDESGSYIQGVTGSLSVEGISGDTGIPDWLLNTDYLESPNDYYLKLTNIPGAVLNVESFDSSSGLTIADVPSFSTGLIGNEIANSQYSGDVHLGSPATEGYVTVPYSLEVVYKDGEQIFGFDNLLYQPISVTIGGIDAANITSYSTLEQPAFTSANIEDGQYEFIHDGKTLYFNQSIAATEIAVDYRWMTKYTKAKCVLRTNKAISPAVTPIVNEYRLKLNTTIL
jgi:hypothetical protein